MTTATGDGRVFPLKRLVEKGSALTGKERLEFSRSTCEQNLLSYKKSSYTAKEEDLFIVTFPRCGTTWTLQIAKLVRNDGKEDGMDIDQALPWIELMSPEEAEVRNALNSLIISPINCCETVLHCIQKLHSILTIALFRTSVMEGERVTNI